MRKLIGAINMTLDGFCDHTAMIADDEIHEHYNDLLRNSGALLYGRVTYGLMKDYWPTVVARPTGNQAADDFARLIDDIPKIVYSRTLQEPGWKHATLKRAIVPEELLALRAQPGKDLCAGSPSLIATLLQLGLLDQLQLSVQPTLAGSGLTLLKNLDHRIDLKLLKTKSFACGALTLYYEPVRKG